jgi:hypothetical protein
MCRLLQRSVLLGSMLERSFGFPYGRCLVCVGPVEAAAWLEAAEMDLVQAMEHQLAPFVVGQEVQLEVVAA